MKKSLFFSIILACASTFSQSKIWKQTTTADFAAGTFDRVVSTTVSDGELQLIHPLVQIGNDTINSSIPRFVSYDDAGNYLQGWVSSKKVYVQKFNNQRQPISNVINVDINARASDYRLGLALLNDGRFVVGWVEAFDSTNGFTYAPRYCQFFDTSNAKVGNNLRVFNLSNATHTIPKPIADQNNRRFLIIGTEGNSTKGFQSYAWLYSPSGVKLRDSVKIVPSSVTKNEYTINGAFHNGKFAFVWSGTDGNTSPTDLYFMLADSNCIPLMAPVRANDNAPKGYSPSATFDDAGNCCVTWIWNAGIIPGPAGRIYGCVFDFSGRKMGGVIQLTNLQTGTIYWQDISPMNGMFRLTYDQQFHNGPPDQQWASYWKIISITSGSFISGIFDAGNQQTNYEQISWNGITSSGTRLKFQLRSSAMKGDIESASWTGPSAVVDYYTNALGETINAATNMKRYLQYKAWFEADNSGDSPVLNDVSISFTGGDMVAPDPPTNTIARGEHRRVVIEWIKSISLDVFRYRVIRSSDSTWQVDLPAQVTSLIDSSVTYTGSYQYSVKAMDSSSNESAASLTNVTTPATAMVFVSQSGTSSGDGSASRPFSFIDRGITYSAAGDTIFVLPGEYNTSDTLTEGIALIGSGTSETKINSSGYMPALSLMKHTIVKNFTFNVSVGIRCLGDSILISENVFLHRGSTPDAAIIASPLRLTPLKGVVISKNIFLNFMMGIYCPSLPFPPYSQISLRNNIMRCQMGVNAMGTSMDIVNNTFIVEGQGYGVTLDNATATIVNNCFAGYQTPGGYIRSINPGANATLDAQYNNRWNFGNESGFPLGATEIAVDPQFVSAAKNNFHYQPGSPCTDAGHPSASYNDIDGSRNDIGAYGGPDPMPASVSLALSADIILTNGSGFVGDTAIVFLQLSNAAGLKDASLEVFYDSQTLNFQKACVTPLTDGFTLSAHQESAGKISLQLHGSQEIASGGGDIVSLAFVVDAATTQEKVCALRLSSVTLLDGSGTPIQISTVSNGVIIARILEVRPHIVNVDAQHIGVGDGSARSPFPTIQNGIDAAKVGDTVLVAPGKYIGPLSMKGGVFVLGLGATVTSIEVPDDPHVLMPAVADFHNVSESGISGFTLTHNSIMGSAIRLESSTATVSQNRIEHGKSSDSYVVVDAFSKLTLSDNVFADVDARPLMAIGVYGGEVTAMRNYFNVACPMNIFALYNSARGTITNNSLTLFSGSTVGIMCGQTKSITIANNLITTAASGGLGIKLAEAESTLIANNTIDVRFSGIDETSTETQILNNIVTSAASGMRVSSPTIHRYNLLWQNILDFAAGSRDATEFNADPLFADKARGNYSLQSSSPARNAGDPSPEWNDHDGSRNDLGVFGGPYADSTSFSQFRTAIRIGSLSARHGDTIAVPVYGVHWTDVGVMKLLVTFDPVQITLGEVRTTTATRSFTLSYKRLGNSMVSVDMEGYRPLSVDSAVVAELVFVVRSGAGQETEIKSTDACLYSTSTRSIPIASVENGRISLKPMGIPSSKESLPQTYALHQNYPNPFNPATVIGYELPVSGRATLKVYDILGREVATLVDEVKIAGRYEKTFDASAFSSGVYFYRIVAVSVSDLNNRFVQVKKMLLLK